MFSQADLSFTFQAGYRGHIHHEMVKEMKITRFQVNLMKGTGALFHQMSTALFHVLIVAKIAHCPQSTRARLTYAEYEERKRWLKTPGTESNVDRLNLDDEDDVPSDGEDDGTNAVTFHDSSEATRERVAKLREIEDDENDDAKAEDVAPQAATGTSTERAVTTRKAERPPPEPKSLPPATDLDLGQVWWWFRPGGGERLIAERQAADAASAAERATEEANAAEEASSMAANHLRVQISRGAVYRDAVPAAEAAANAKAAAAAAARDNESRARLKASAAAENLASCIAVAFAARDAGRARLAARVEDVTETAPGRNSQRSNDAMLQQWVQEAIEVLMTRGPSYQSANIRQNSRKSSTVLTSWSVQSSAPLEPLGGKIQHRASLPNAGIAPTMPSAAKVVETILEQHGLEAFGSKGRMAKFARDGLREADARARAGISYARYALSAFKDERSAAWRALSEANLLQATYCPRYAPRAGCVVKSIAFERANSCSTSEPPLYTRPPDTMRLRQSATQNTYERPSGRTFGRNLHLVSPPRTVSAFG